MTGEIKLDLEGRTFAYFIVEPIPGNVDIVTSLNKPAKTIAKVYEFSPGNGNWVYVEDIELSLSPEDADNLYQRLQALADDIIFHNRTDYLISFHNTPEGRLLEVEMYAIGGDVYEASVLSFLPYKYAFNGVGDIAAFGPVVSELGKGLESIATKKLTL